MILVFISGIATNYFVVHLNQNMTLLNNDNKTTNTIQLPTNYNNGIDPRAIRTVSSITNNIDAYYNTTVTVIGNFTTNTGPRPAIACQMIPNPLPSTTYDDSYYSTSKNNGNFIAEFSNPPTLAAIAYLQIETTDNHGVPRADLPIPLKQGQYFTLQGKIVKSYVPEICAGWKLHKSAYLLVQPSSVGIYYAQPASLIPFYDLIKQ